MRLDFTPDMNRLLAYRPVERQRLLDSIFGCQTAAAPLHQRHQMRRIEWMSQHYSFGTGGRILDVADQNTRRTRRDKAVGGDYCRNLGQKIALHIDPFRAVLLDE